LIDDDWRKRKGRWDSVRLWAIGQALAAQEQLDVLLDPQRGRDGLFPELVIFDCHACHRPMTEARWEPRPGARPGAIRFNDGNLLMLRQIVRRVAPGEAEAFANAVTRLHRAVGSEASDAMAAGRDLRDRLARLIGTLKGRAFSHEDLRSMLASLVADGVAGEYRDYAAAEQATMAMASLLNFLARQGVLADVQSANAALDAVYATVRDDARYQPERYRADLARLGATLKGKAP
jgi:hypothetical protein